MTTDQELISTLHDDEWWWDQKVDGIRLGIIIDDNTIRAVNRRGEIITTPAGLANSFHHKTGGHWVFDGEYCEGTLWIFDLVYAPDNTIGPSTPLETRRECLELAHKTMLDSPHVRLLPQTRTAHDKAALLQWVIANNGEGVMVKNRHASYAEGLRSKNVLKYKLTATIDVVILETWREGKRSCAVGVHDDTGELMDIGSVTFTEKNLEQAKPGDVIEVKYLYVGAGGRLYQPRFLRWRTDKTPDECTADQMKVGTKVVASVNDYSI